MVTIIIIFQLKGTTIAMGLGSIIQFKIAPPMMDSPVKGIRALLENLGISFTENKELAADVDLIV
jgi:hypothetical protein